VRSRFLTAFTLAALLCVAALQAQSPGAKATLSSATCPGSGCVVLSVSGVGGAAVQVTGTYSGTLSFEGSVDGTTFAALNLTPMNSTTAASSTTSTGVWSGGIGGLTVVRVRMSSYTSGSAVVTIQAAPTSSRSSGGGGGTPGGADTQVQFNDAGAFAGDSDFTFDGSLAALGALTDTGNLYLPPVGRLTAQYPYTAANEANYVATFNATTATAGVKAHAIQLGAVASHTSGTVAELGGGNVAVYSNGNTSTTTYQYGLALDVEQYGTGSTTTSLQGLNIYMATDGVGTTATNAYGVNTYFDGTYGHLYGLYLNDQSALTVSGNNHAINYADKFLVDATGFVGLVEQTAPAAGAANSARIYAKDNGAGKTQLCAIFSSGAEQCFATQP